jgi:hypothetical protein
MSDDRRIVIKFVMKKHIFITKYLLLRMIDDWIFITLVSQIAKHDEILVFVT